MAKKAIHTTKYRTYLCEQNESLIRLIEMFPGHLLNKSKLVYFLVELGISPDEKSAKQTISELRADKIVEEHQFLTSKVRFIALTRFSLTYLYGKNTPVNDLTDAIFHHSMFISVYFEREVLPRLKKPIKGLVGARKSLLKGLGTTAFIPASFANELYSSRPIKELVGEDPRTDKRGEGLNATYNCPSLRSVLSRRVVLQFKSDSTGVRVICYYFDLKNNRSARQFLEVLDIVMHYLDNALTCNYRLDFIIATYDSRATEKFKANLKSLALIRGVWKPSIITQYFGLNAWPEDVTVVFKAFDIKKQFYGGSKVNPF